MLHCDISNQTFSFFLRMNPQELYKLQTGVRGVEPKTYHTQALRFIALCLC